ncbi:pentatricopeptide repeat-containing protein At4g04790, mitochondrial-like isoform X2 [Tripterygium wilfordii]|uniref:pentatricopeptide repeat-containing protein At4g04790, mitochondrial-like isoform X2 n=1 Tax=Tripterygium wilfordii TaxID=458696 RepID=UPI0018F85086|nr:pentatricopeptide repeat-containing protein At4g04790, mitochondrial-like isoform X2 [Tripterygium wilfordii]
MPASKGRNLVSLFRARAKTTLKSATTKTSPAGDTTLKQFVSSLDPSSPTLSTTFISKSLSKCSAKFPKPKPSVPELSGQWAIPGLTNEAPLSSGSSLDPQETKNENSTESVLDIPWIPDISRKDSPTGQKGVSRERKSKWVFKSGQVNRFNLLVKMCADRLGTDVTLEVFGKLGRETGVKEYNALIGICIKNARNSDDEEVAMEQISRAFQLFKSMRGQGFQLKEETYAPLLIYLIDMGMIEEFHFFCGVVKDENPSSLSKLGYYEMLLWIRVNNEEKIEELCDYIATQDNVDDNSVQENYLLALCESDRNANFRRLMEIIDITKVQSMDLVASIFKALGRHLLESFMERFLLAFKNCEDGTEKISTLIFCYAAHIPNLAVEEVVSKFKSLHAQYEVAPSSMSYEKLISYCCDSLKVHIALDIVDQMCKTGLTISTGTLNSILNASEGSFEFNLVERIHSLIIHHDLKPNTETFRTMISLRVKMKDYIGAYELLNNLKELNLPRTVSMYNAIMAGFFREKNIVGGFSVLKQMENADVKPDSQTFSYLISHCDSEERINKYYEEMQCVGVQVTKQVVMALINAYASIGQFEKAKQVLADKGVSTRGLTECKSALVSALASHGQISDALQIYKEIKDAECDLEPKAIISLIEHTQSEGEISRLFKLLKELHDQDYWVDGCCRVLLYCVRNKHTSSAIDLLKQLDEKLCNDELALGIIVDEVFSIVADTDDTHLDVCLNLLRAIKDELGLSPSRKCLDFLLSACVNAKDLQSSLFIWRQYEIAGLPYNVVSYLRMYQALLASGAHRSAKDMLSKIPKDDRDVRSIIQACQLAFKHTIAEAKPKTKRKKKGIGM